MHVLCINPDMNARMRFKQVAQAVPSFASVSLASSLSEGLERARGAIAMGAVYISRRFETETVREFVHSSRHSERGATSAHLMIMNEAQVERDEVASFTLLGIDGFLLEPFSAAALQTTARIAQRVSRDRSFARERAGLDLLIPRLLEELDTSAHAPKTAKVSGATINSRMKQLGQMVQGLPEHLLAEYFERLIAATDARPAPAIQFDEPLSREDKGVPSTQGQRRITRHSR